MRPDWDSYFMKIAYAVSERSTCDRAFVGCVLVLEKRILTTGFNGSPAGQGHCVVDIRQGVVAGSREHQVTSRGRCPSLARHIPSPVRLTSPLR